MFSKNIVTVDEKLLIFEVPQKMDALVQFKINVVTDIKYKITFLLIPITQISQKMREDTRLALIVTETKPDTKENTLGLTIYYFT